MTGSIYTLLTGGATRQFSTQVTWYACMHQGTELSLFLLPPTAPSCGRPNNNTPGHQGEQQVHSARWDAELCVRRGYTKIEKYSVSPAPPKAPAHSSLHIRSLRHTHARHLHRRARRQRRRPSSSACTSQHLSQRASALKKRALYCPHRQNHTQCLWETSFQEYTIAARAHVQQNRGQ